ncbi:sodium:solute symporter family transporter [Stieleria varia]|nr:sodium/solute symporter [Stieleria varia]
MHPLDLLVIAIYLIVILSLGFVFGRNQSRSEFFVASRSMNWLTVGLSVMATLFSSNSFVFYPAAAMGDSLRIGLSLVAFALMTPIVMFVFVPVYARLKVETAYEYLELRFQVSVRALAAGLFVLLRIGWMASATYAASLVVSEVAGVPQTVVIVGLGVIAIGYTMVGGLRAVMWTDVIQFFVFALTILATFGLILSKTDTGIGGVLSTYFDGRSGMVVDFELSLTLQYGSWAILIGVFLEGLSAFGVDQVAVQRYLSAKSIRTSQVGAMLNLIGMWVVVPALLMIGVALYSYYSQHPDELAPARQIVQTLPEIIADNPKIADHAMPNFVRVHFPAGMAGLFLAALMAAIMSSIDSGVHSVTTVLVVDFRDRLFPDLRPDSARGELRMIRVMVLLIGVLSIGLACMVGPMGNVFDIGKKLTAAFGGPLLAIFVLALFTKRTSAIGVLVGAVSATAVTLVLMYTQTWFSVWYWPIGFGMSLTLGYVISLMRPSPATEFTFNRIMQKVVPD